MDLCKKKESSGSDKDLHGEYGRRWIWTAIDTPTRLLITFSIGGRELPDARRMLQELTGRSRDKALFVSDELSHYATVLAELFHQLVPSTRTGKPGRPKKPVRLIDADLDYATIEKTREAGRVVQVERRIVYGSQLSVQQRLANSPSRTINTSYVERSNLNWRLWNAHLTRKALTFARSVRWLRAKFAIVAACYNLIRPHGTLSRGHDRVFRPKTPAMAARLTDHPWTLIELLTHPVLCQ